MGEGLLVKGGGIVVDGFLLVLLVMKGWLGGLNVVGRHGGGHCGRKDEVV